MRKVIDGEGRPIQLLESIMKIADLIRFEPIVATPDDTAETIREKFIDHGIHCLPVVDEMRTAIGIVTSTDLEDDIPDETPVGQIMSDNIFPVGPNDDARDAARLMRDQQVHHLVVTEEGKVAGVISALDLLRVIEES